MAAKQKKTKKTKKPRAIRIPISDDGPWMLDVVATASGANAARPHEMLVVITASERLRLMTPIDRPATPDDVALRFVDALRSPPSGEPRARPQSLIVAQTWMLEALRKTAKHYEIDVVVSGQVDLSPFLDRFGFGQPLHRSDAMASGASFYADGGRASAGTITAEFDAAFNAEIEAFNVQLKMLVDFEHSVFLGEAKYQLPTPPGMDDAANDPFELTLPTLGIKASKTDAKRLKKALNGMTDVLVENELEAVERGILAVYESGDVNRLLALSDETMAAVVRAMDGVEEEMLALVISGEGVGGPAGPPAAEDVVATYFVGVLIESQLSDVGDIGPSNFGESDRYVFEVSLRGADLQAPPIATRVFTGDTEATFEELQVAITAVVGWGDAVEFAFVDDSGEQRLILTQTEAMELDGLHLEHGGGAPEATLIHRFFCDGAERDCVYLHGADDSATLHLKLREVNFGGGFDWAVYAGVGVFPDPKNPDAAPAAFELQAITERLIDALG